MPKFRVIFETVASYGITVEAEDEIEAEEVAFEEADFPYFPGGMGGDIGEWYINDKDPYAVEQVDDSEPVGDGRW